MKNSIYKISFFIGMLFLAIIGFEKLMNQGNTDMTAEMEPAAYPLVYILEDGKKLNEMHAYRDKMQIPYMRDTLTAIDGSRVIKIEVEKFGTEIASLSYEVRTGDGNRLIEDTEITDYHQTKDAIIADCVIKDLLKDNMEYSLTFLLKLASGESLTYYTRVVKGENFNLPDKLNFIRSFHEATFEKDAGTDRLIPYLESNSAGKNSSFSETDIHSSLFQVTWGDLSVQKKTDPIYNIKEIRGDTMSAQLTYTMSLGDEDSICMVTEYYRIRYTKERMYLLDYSREANEIFNEKAKVYGKNSIDLGVHGLEKVSLVECDGGDIFAFSCGQKLYSYNVSDNKLARLFAFGDWENMDARALYANHDIKILNVDETGNIQFLIYGYMNRGKHEGRVGIRICIYNNSLHTIEEQLFIPYDRSPEVLAGNIRILSYANQKNQFYVMLNNSVYEIDLEKKSCNCLVSGLNDDSYQMSNDGRMIAWTEGEDAFSGEKLILMDLAKREKLEMDPGVGEYILPLAFMENDLIVGYAGREDVVRDRTEKVLYPMHRIEIISETGESVKKYNAVDAYITDCEIIDNQIILHRIKRNERGLLEELPDDQILNSKVETEGKNKIKTIVTDDMETTVQIDVKKEINQKSLKILTPKEVLFEGENKVLLPETEKNTKDYFVYSVKGLEKIRTREASAVNLAYEMAGSVMNEKGNIVWSKISRVTRNQIMKITEEQAEEGESSIAVCIDTILKYEGVGRGSQYMLDTGRSVREIMEDYISKCEVLDLTGCSLDAVLYYVNQDIPVMAMLEDGNAVLITGFNESNVVIMNPLDGTLAKMGMNDATEWLLENGNRFITYIKNEE